MTVTKYKAVKLALKDAKEFLDHAKTQNKIDVVNYWENEIIEFNKMLNT